MSVPAWKQAILDRKKQQQKEEELKQAEEEAYLASLPPWKRSLFLKKKKEVGGTSTAAAAATTTTQPNRPATKQQQTNSAPSVAPTSAVQKTTNKQSTWGRTQSPKTDESSKQQESLSVSNTNNNNTDSSPSWSRKPVASTVTPSTQRETSPPASVSATSTESIPLWKRNLMQRQAAPKAPTTTVHTTEQPKQPTQSSAIKTRTSDSNIPKVSDSSTTRASGPSASDNKTTTDSSQKSSGAFDDIDDSRLTSLPPWKRDLILRKRAAAAKEKEKQAEMAPAFIPKVTKRPPQEIDNSWKTSDTTDGAKSRPIVKRISDDKISMWRKAEQTTRRSSRELDVVVKPGDNEAKETLNEVEQATASQEPSVDTKQTTKLVNGIEKEEQDEKDKEAAPPILKDKDPWAHVSEDDPQFKALPPWKQAMIMRRRYDIRRRSNPEINVSSLQKSTQDETDFAEEVPAWKKEAMLKKSQDKADDNDDFPDIDDDMPEWKKEKLREQFKNKSKSKSLPALLPSNKQVRNKQPSENIPEWKKEAMKGKQTSQKDDDIPEWKKEQQLKQKQQQQNIPEWKKEAMKSQKTVEKKDDAPVLKSMKPLSPERNTQSPSPTKTSNPIPDDDEDDVPCTNIDDISDSEESDDATGSYDVNPEPSTVRVGSASSGYGSDTNSPGTKHVMRRATSSKSILVTRKISYPVSASQLNGFCCFYISVVSVIVMLVTLAVVFLISFSKGNEEYHGMRTR